MFQRLFLALFLCGVASPAALAQITFAPHTAFSTGTNPREVVLADINGDGRLDVIVANQGAGSIGVLLGNGAGGLLAATSFPGPAQPVNLALGDFNGDGRLDVAVADATGGLVSVGNGDGTFGAATTYPGFSTAVGVATADLDGDGVLDLVVTFQGGTGVAVLRGNGNGTFQAKVDYAVGGFMFDPVLADMNGDGRLDLVAARNSTGEVVVLPGTGAATFGAAQAFPVGNGPTAIGVVDLNGDGILDIAVANSSGGANTLSILLGVGNGTFLPQSTLATADPLGIVTADFDRDGRVDLAASSRIANQVLVFKGNGDGTFAAGIPFAVGAQPYGLAAADMDGDGRLDIVVANRSGNSVGVLLNTTSVVPLAPTAVIATPGSAQLGVAFTPPADSASAPIDYTANCGGNTATGAGSPLVVTGLTNGIAYTCTVTARNATGTGPASTPSNSATPQSPSTVALATSASPVAIGTSITFTATVAGTSPTGAVNFRDGGISLPGCGAVALTAGSAQCVTSFATPGSRVITADYAGDIANLASTGTLAGGQVVNPTGAGVAVATSASPVTIGASVTFTATVTGTTPTGTVSFKDGGTTLTGCGAVALTAGSAQCVASFVTAGARVITADYSGDGLNSPSTGTLAGGQVVSPRTSFTGPIATGTGNATVSFTGGGPTCTFSPQGNGPLQSAFFIPVTGHAKSPPAGSAPASVTFPHGLVDFVLVDCAPGSQVSFTITYPSALGAGTQYWKYGPTAAAPTPHWYVLPATIAGNTATFSITDGGLGDDDLAANGTVVDQGGPGTPPEALRQVPTLSEWALMLLALLMATLAGARLTPSSADRSKR
jgi:hypothetical protein